VKARCAAHYHVPLYASRSTSQTWLKQQTNQSPHRVAYGIVEAFLRTAVYELSTSSAGSIPLSIIPKTIFIPDNNN